MSNDRNNNHTYPYVIPSDFPGADNCQPGILSPDPDAMFEREDRDHDRDYDGDEGDYPDPKPVYYRGVVVDYDRWDFDAVPLSGVVSAVAALSALLTAELRNLVVMYNGVVHAAGLLNNYSNQHVSAFFMNAICGPTKRGTAPRRFPHVTNDAGRLLITLAVNTEKHRDHNRAVAWVGKLAEDLNENADRSCGSFALRTGALARCVDKVGALYSLRERLIDLAIQCGHHEAQSFWTAIEDATAQNARLQPHAMRERAASEVSHIWPFAAVSAAWESYGSSGTHGMGRVTLRTLFCAHVRPTPAKPSACIGVHEPAPLGQPIIGASRHVYCAELDCDLHTFIATLLA